MERYTHIRSLIKKLLDDNLSPRELNELQQLFRTPEAQNNVNIWLSDLWKDSDQQDIPVDSQLMFEQIERKIKNIRGKGIPQKNTHDRTLKIVRSMMRYAAVSILTLALSWFWFWYKTSSQAQPDAVKTSFAAGVNEISVMYGSKTRIVLPDSSLVYLNSGSTLSYPPVFGNERHVTLTGEAYFVVQSDSLHPFLVHTSELSIKALGTEFNVKAYPEEQHVETVLVEGSVEILKKNQLKPIIELKPGEKATYVKPVESSQNISAPAKITPEPPRMYVKVEPEPEISTSWVNNHLVFNAEPFEKIAVRLERWFNVEIDVRNPKLNNTQISGRYDTENIEQVMRSLQLTTPFKYQIIKNKIIIR